MADADGPVLVEAPGTEAATLALEVIEISEDGSWETKPLPAAELNTSTEGETEAQPDFLAAKPEENVKIKHVVRTHTSQYYINCPVASVRPMVQEALSNGKVGAEAGHGNGTSDLVNGGEIESLKVERSPSGAVMNGGLNGVHVVGCRSVAGDEEAADEELSAASVEVIVGGPAEDDGGVVVTESIIENKEKTKSYWEEMMLAAAAGGPSPPRSTPRGEGECSPPPATVPKIVEAVAKRAEGAEGGPEEGAEEGGEGGARAETPAELRIAMELREMREREDELRRLRQELGLSRGEEEEGVGGGRDDSALHSIPTTDEGNFSECGAEDSEGKGRNDTMSPDMPSLESPPENEGSYAHRRTQSMDSTSSGHSSASGGPQRAAGIEYPPRRRLIVKPFTNAEEDPNFRETVIKDENTMNLENQSPSSPFRVLKETPIEREIRIAREREEELRREKGIIQPTNQSAVVRPEALLRSTVTTMTPTGKAGSQSVQLRLATSRIQREIQETTEREKELREAGKIQTMSEDTVDSKVTRIGDRVSGSGTMFEKKIQKSASAFQVVVPDLPPSSVVEERTTPMPPSTPVASAKPQVAHSTPSFILNRSISVGAGLGGARPLPHRFTPTSGQKGLMERFLASRGKLTCISPFNSPSPPSSSPSAVPIPSSSHSSPSAKSTFSSIHLGNPVVKNASPVPVVHKPPEADNQQAGGEGDPTEAVLRRGWTSAEEKIQEELKEMKMREDELRLQRAHLMAQSQPNLLSIMDDAEEGSQWNEDASKLPSLYSTLSNPSLLDLDGDSPVREVDSTQEQAGQKSIRRKKSSLIAHWENRIQQNN